ncbi:DUF5590 domain-containing protein [Bacillus carboniphilus]|uniref:DUF5590 domain-containing protein n=1 Tax=Bacillus carboniphilus TaxID=86663 RepID=A0ABP3GPB5_9BACI
MKKWIHIGIGLLVVVLILVSVLVYFSIQPQQEKKNIAYQVALEKSNLETTEDFHWFRYDKDYYVVGGKDTDGEKSFVWIAADSLDIIAEHKASEGLSEKEVLETYKDEWNINELVDVKLGYANERPLWEITFIDDQNKYTFLQVSFLTGDWIRYYQYRRGGGSS